MYKKLLIINKEKTHYPEKQVKDFLISLNIDESLSKLVCYLTSFQKEIVDVDLSDLSIKLNESIEQIEFDLIFLQENKILTVLKDSLQQQLIININLDYLISKPICTLIEDRFGINIKPEKDKINYINSKSEEYMLNEEQKLICILKSLSEAENKKFSINLKLFDQSIQEILYENNIVNRVMDFQFSDDIFTSYISDNDIEIYKSDYENYYFDIDEYRTDLQIYKIINNNSFKELEVPIKALYIHFFRFLLESKIPNSSWKTVSESIRFSKNLDFEMTLFKIRKIYSILFHSKSPVNLHKLYKH
jgi:hypothetical protein